MLDWDSLIAATEGQMDSAGQTDAKFSPVKPGASPANRTDRTKPEANNGGPYKGFSPASPVSPAEKQREGKKVEEKSAPGGGVAAENFAPEKAISGQQSARFQTEPQAVVMVLAVARRKGADIENLAATLQGLGDMEPGEQIMRWHRVCLAEGIKPWLLIHPKAPEAGMDCLGCSHISSAFEFIPDLGRRCFSWLCGLGHSIHVHDHAGERVLVAPPECHSWERWKMKG
jgi:hypothetical protein